MNVVLCIFIALNSYNSEVSVIRLDKRASYVVEGIGKMGMLGWKWVVVGGGDILSFGASHAIGASSYDDARMGAHSQCNG